MTGRVTICAVVDEVLDVEAHRRSVEDASGGAQVLFCGVVRDHDQARSVVALEYQGHPDASDVLSAIAGDYASRPGVLSVAVSHRLGELTIGDVALVAAVSTPHRRQAFELCAELVDQVKRQLPIWKRQVFLDGTDEWVNCP